MRKLREEMGREQPTATERIDAAKVASLRATWWDADSMVRTDNALTKGGYLRVVDVIDVHDRELMKVHNFGRHCLRDVRAIIEAIGPVTSAEIAAAKAAP
jgi:DNA-directed RNA polymerase alpha subunit